MRNRCLFFDKSKEPDLQFDEIEREIEAKIRRIDELKLRILYTYNHTQLANGMLLQEAIVNLGNLRSELKCYNTLLEKDPEARLMYYVGKAQIKDYVSRW